MTSRSARRSRGRPAHATRSAGPIGHHGRDVHIGEGGRPHLRRAEEVGRHHADAGRGDGLGHRRLAQAGGVVDDRRPGRHGGGGDLGLEGVDGHRHVQLGGEALDHRHHAARSPPRAGVRLAEAQGLAAHLHHVGPDRGQAPPCCDRGRGAGVERRRR
jgi:hypothetical protein